ncbi:hypothetical protein [Ancylobacter sp.]|uniref:hypothetical protein n=1 Tax=Ancylobacter sp. TaxID=1872567 RepID=UPI003D0ED85C
MNDETSDREVGDAWMAHILGSLYERWPRRVDFSALDLGAKTSLEPPRDPEEFFDDLIRFLDRNGYVDADQRIEGSAFGVALTDKGLSTLGSPIEADQKALGTRLKEAATEAGKETGRHVIAELVGLVIGSALKSASGGSA